MKQLGEKKTVIKIQSALDKLISIPLFLLCLAILIVGIAAIFNEQTVTYNANASKEYKKKILAPDKEYPSIDELQKTNPEIIAWLTLDGTEIDFPITQTKDNAKYLNTTFDGKYAVSGNPFLDYRNNIESDDYSIIYGHRMNQQKMFGGLIKYSDENYLKSHKTGTITTKQGTYKLDVLAFAVEKISTTKVYDLAKYKEGQNSAILSEILSHATATSTVIKSGNYELPEKLLLLSTCDKDSKHYRDVLLLEFGEEI